MARTDPQVNVRMPSKLKSELEAAATASGRSLTAEIVYRLESSLLDEEFRALAEEGTDLAGQMGEMLKKQYRQIEQRDKTIQNMAEMMQVSARQIEQLQEIIEKRLLAAGR